MDEPENHEQRPPEWRPALSKNSHPFAKLIDGVKPLLPIGSPFGSLNVRSEAQIGPLVDCFAAFAMLDEKLSSVEVDLILDLLRSAYPEIDQTWLKRRLRRSVNFPSSLRALASDLRNTLDEATKLSLGLELFALVSTSGRYQQRRASFDIFMRKLGKPEFGSAISQC